jgi:hypothetical protein
MDDLIASVFLQALREVLPQLKNQDDARLIKRIGKDKYQIIEDDLNGFLDNGVTGSLTKNEKAALAVKSLKCLADYIKENMSMPITFNTMIDSQALLPHAVDNSFPGYAEAKLLKHAIIRSSL